MTEGGFPHSDISGSKLTYSSPERFAVRRVLLRLLVPRHPPCALFFLTTRYAVFFDAAAGQSPAALCCLCVFGLGIRLSRSNVQKNKQRDRVSQKESQARPLPGPCGTGVLLHRKEVIHPHLPVGIPCYDFTPIICPTFGGWVPEGFPHRLRVLQTLVV